MLKYVNNIIEFVELYVRMENFIIAPKDGE